ncbi:dirigent protein 21-like [Andrographis paniculata]|uniref:dirigent protein 21-like n=1 Tax=Andrographis paniculata TaxID=175694 RepID=UPI0021E8A47C|nr:dirigent protein 21-like [Andrographis paniculata]
MATLFVSILLSSLFTLTKSTFSDGSAAAAAAATTTHLHFFLHDIVSGRHPTSIRVAGEKNKFGMTAVIDDPLTEGAEHGSPIVGRAQGMYTSSALDAMSLHMAVNFEFLAGEFNGSTLSILGRNAFMEAVREFPIVGGTGRFRFAQGYALAKTKRFNAPTGDAVVEYDVFVMHR